MHIALLILLIVLALFFYEAQIIWVTYLTALLILADLFGGMLSKFFSVSWNAVQNVNGVANTEFEEVRNSKPNPPSGRKMFEKGFEEIGEGLGIGVKATNEGKNITKHPGLFSFTGEIADDILEGIQKLFK